MTNVEKIAAVNRWQAEPLVHSLTCGNDSCHMVLRPTEVNGRVILVCPDCEYQQSFVPDEVLTFAGPSRELLDFLSRSKSR
jgi:hypothetical protein